MNKNPITINKADLDHPCQSEYWEDFLEGLGIDSKAQKVVIELSTKDTNKRALPKLLPCPHCGSDKVQVNSGLDHNHRVSCFSCMDRDQRRGNLSEVDAIKKWNIRTEQQTC